MIKKDATSNAKKRALIIKTGSIKLGEDEFMALDNPFKKPKKPKSCLFHQSSKCKFYWDLVMTALLFFICLIIPVHMAFKSENVVWCRVYLSIDFFFLVDMILTFFTSLPAAENEDEVTDRKVIAITYLKKWFLVELAAIMPFDLIFSSLAG